MTSRFWDWVLRQDEIESRERIAQLEANLRERLRAMDLERAIKLQQQAFENRKQLEAIRLQHEKALAQERFAIQKQLEATRLQHEKALAQERFAIQKQLEDLRLSKQQQLQEQAYEHRAKLEDKRFQHQKELLQLQQQKQQERMEKAQKTAEKKIDLAMLKQDPLGSAILELEKQGEVEAAKFMREKARFFLPTRLLGFAMRGKSELGRQAIRLAAEKGLAAQIPTLLAMPPEKRTAWLSDWLAKTIGPENWEELLEEDERRKIVSDIINIYTQPATGGKYAKQVQAYLGFLQQYPSLTKMIKESFVGPLQKSLLETLKVAVQQGDYRMFQSALDKARKSQQQIYNKTAKELQEDFKALQQGIASTFPSKVFDKKTGKIIEQPLQIENAKALLNQFSSFLDKYDRIFKEYGAQGNFGVLKQQFDEISKSMINKLRLILPEIKASGVNIPENIRKYFNFVFDVNDEAEKIASLVRIRNFDMSPTISDYLETVLYSYPIAYAVPIIMGKKVQGKFPAFIKRRIMSWHGYPAPIIYYLANSQSGKGIVEKRGDEYYITPDAFKSLYEVGTPGGIDSKFTSYGISPLMTPLHVNVKFAKKAQQATDPQQMILALRAFYKENNPILWDESLKLTYRQHSFDWDKTISGLVRHWAYFEKKEKERKSKPYTLVAEALSGRAAEVFNNAAAVALAGFNRDELSMLERAQILREIYKELSDIADHAVFRDQKLSQQTKAMLLGGVFGIRKFLEKKLPEEQYKTIAITLIWNLLEKLDYSPQKMRGFIDILYNFSDDPDALFLIISEFLKGEGE